MTYHFSLILCLFVSLVGYGQEIQWLSLDQAEQQQKQTGKSIIILEENLEAFIIKYNITERLFYSPLSKSSVIKLYDYIDYKKNNYSIENSHALIIRNKQLFKTQKIF